MNKNGIKYSRSEYRKEYLSSLEWKEKSFFILSRDPICRICDKNKSQDAHHLTYENLPFENLEKDLIGVCRKCHNRIHKHYELSSLKDFFSLKELYLKSLNKKFFVEEKEIKIIINANQHNIMKLCALFKIIPDVLRNLEGKYLDYFTYQHFLKILENSKKHHQRSKGKIYFLKDKKVIKKEMDIITPSKMKSNPTPIILEKVTLKDLLNCNSVEEEYYILGLGKPNIKTFN